MKNMKSDWLSCLDNDVGFKVRISSMDCNYHLPSLFVYVPPAPVLPCLSHFPHLMLTATVLQGFAVPKESQGKVAEFSFHGTPAKIKHGDVVIAAITSCTNTSNPNVMLGAALVAKKACELGLEVWSWTTSSILFSPYLFCQYSIAYLKA